METLPHAMRGRRFLEGVAFLFLVLAAAFLFVRMLPGDPVDIRLQSSMVAGDEATAAVMRSTLGLDQPLWLQFVDWIGGLSRLDGGRSLASDRPVLAELAARLPWSFAIGNGGLLLGVTFGTLLGYASCFHRHGIASAFSRMLVIASQSIPSFAVAFLVFWLVAVELQWIRPVFGSPIERIAGPILVVALFATGPFARVTFGTLVAVQSSSWFMTALAKGLSRKRAMIAHGGRSVVVANAAVLVPELGWAVGGTAVSEIVFGVSGLSAYIVEAAASRDYAVLQLYLVAIFVWLGTAHGCITALRSRIDPRPEVRR